MSVEGGAGGFFHNMVVTVDPYSEQDLNYCFRIDTESLASEMDKVGAGFSHLQNQLVELRNRSDRFAVEIGLAKSA